MTQHSMKKRNKAFSDAGIEAVLKELKQLHNQKVMEPKSAMSMTQADSRAALKYLTLKISKKVESSRAEVALMEGS
jgi:hypothetical protein